MCQLNGVYPMREQTGGASALLEAPRAQRSALRPDLAVLFARVKSGDGRHTCCVLTVRERGYG